uniref:nucleotide exchange factor GrpE n=1 Tax=Thaumasiovibrio occultus TaxID=1891184 RepID=UPI000B34FB91|nr:nucleotide exchange factor GrpE [Thaumasiovibrio occultus]
MSKEENKVQEEQLDEVVETTEEVEATEVDVEEVQDETSLLLTKIEELKTALAQSDATVQEQRDSVLRAKAEVENMRRRTEQETEKARKFALERFAGELLPVIDNMERAVEMADKNDETIKPMVEGVELTLKTMVDAVEKFGLKAINPVNETFNPELHQAMGIQESADHAPNTVMFVMQKGYELNGRVVRPAMVMVSKAASGNVDTQA